MQEVSWLNTWHYRNRVPYLIKSRKNQNMQRGQKMLCHWGAISIEISSITFLKLKRNPEVVFRFKKCLSLFGNRKK